MFILDLLTEGFRSLALLLDSVAFSLLGEIYGLFNTIASLSLINQKEISSIINNMYVVVGIFAFFRIAVLLINTMITPDALTKQGAGLSKIAVNTVIMIVLLVLTPTLFSWSRDVSSKIVSGHYVEKLFLNTDIGSADPSNAMERIAVGAVITVNDEFLDLSENSKKGRLIPNSDCTGDCEKAVYCLQDINGLNYKTDDEGNYVLDNDGNKVPDFKSDCLDNEEGIIWSKLSDYNAVTKKKTYVYNYRYFILTIVGWVMAYVLLSFTFDVAKRMVELAILEILSPLFIATIVDPKSMQSGTFKKWAKTLGSSYVSLFIRQASVAIMLLCAQLLMRWTPNENVNVGFFGKLIILLGVLIFAKGFPKWIGNMVGLQGDGLGGLSLKKKLASAALIGGAFQKASDGAKKYASQKSKNFAANRLRNTAARVGGSNEARRSNKELKQQMKESGSYDRQAYRNARQSIFKQGRAAANRSRSDNWGKDAQGTIKDIATGYMAGRLNVNADAKGLGQNMQQKQADKANAYNQKLGNTNRNIERAELAGKLKKASEMRVGKIPAGERDKKINWQGYEEFKSAIGDKVMTEKEAYIKDLKNLANKNGWTVDSAGIAYDASGRQVMTWEQHKNSFTDAGKKDIAAFVTKNFQNSSEALKANVDLKISNDQKIAGYKAQIASLQPGRDDAAITALNGQIIQLDKQNEQIKNVNNNIIKDISASEQTFANEPQKCPSAVKVDDDTYVTAVGKYTRGSDGKFTYSVSADVSKFGFDPTSINAVMNKIATIADKKDSDAKDAHKAMNPDKS